MMGKRRRGFKSGWSNSILSTLYGFRSVARCVCGRWQGERLSFPKCLTYQVGGDQSSRRGRMGGYCSQSRHREWRLCGDWVIVKRGRCQVSCVRCSTVCPPECWDPVQRVAIHVMKKWPCRRDWRVVSRGQDWGVGVTLRMR